MHISSGALVEGVRDKASTKCVWNSRASCIQSDWKIFSDDWSDFT